jgi:hypothetical protein
MRNESLVTVFNAIDEVQALLYRTVLEEAGIDVVERQLETPWFETVKQQALHSQLQVRREDEARALELIAAFHEEAERGKLTVDNPQDLPDTPGEG